MGNIILQTKDLCKTFKGQKAVNHISLSIEENSLYGLLGPNGAGKSTTLKMITGMLRPTSGQILFQGHPWRRRDLDNIGALIESPPLISLVHEGLAESHKGKGYSVIKNQQMIIYQRRNLVQRTAILFLHTMKELGYNRQQIIEAISQYSHGN